MQDNKKAKCIFHIISITIRKIVMKFLNKLNLQFLKLMSVGSILSIVLFTLSVTIYYFCYCFMDYYNALIKLKQENLFNKALANMTIVDIADNFLS